MKNFLVYYLVTFYLSISIAAAQEPGPAEPLGLSQEPLAVMGDVTLTQGELDAAFSRIPADKRLMFVRDGAKVEQLVRNLLRSKALANEAIKAGYDQETLVKLRLELGREGALAQEWLAKVVEDAPEVDFEALAEENYLLDPEAWKTEDRIDVSHILVSTDSRSEEEAKDIAGGIWQQLQLQPENFDELVVEYSDDASKDVNGGRFPDVKRGEMVPNFEKIAFSMTMPGEISAPTQTPYGFHIIRLNKKMPGEIPPFESIRDEAVLKAKADYKTEYRNKYLRNTVGEKIVLQDGAAEAVAKRYFGENLELAPDFTED